MTRLWTLTRSRRSDEYPTGAPEGSQSTQHLEMRGKLEAALVALVVEVAVVVVVVEFVVEEFVDEKDYCHVIQERHTNSEMAVTMAIVVGMEV